MSGADPDRAAELDARDPLARFRDRFVFADPDVVYFDGNSLGRLPVSTAARLARVVSEEWGGDLIRSWRHWRNLPRRVGDVLAGPLLGAAPGSVAVSDSTSVNLYKLAVAALDAQPDRAVIVTDEDNFVSDRFLLDGVAAARGAEVRYASTPPDEGLSSPAADAALGRLIDGDVALVCLSHVSYLSGGIADMVALTALAHDAGAMVLWDLSHSVGAVPVDLAGAGVDLAVGCTYKYLNAGPGAPAFLYVSHELQDRLRQPIWGWFGQSGQFEMGPRYEPARGVASYLTGTPNVIGTMMVAAAVEVIEEAGVDALWQKSRRLTEMLVGLIDTHLAPLGAVLASPRRPEARGAHVSVSHPQAWPWCRNLVTRRLVVGDFRPPDVIRL
ncbi:MAG TPA: aminotransferase class V-fold PLP-dependent enzyme, partial [Acidimicrobiales bacterium]|nr:aminotransferase class V-fold PLP-dependent enzyme [Acidimicrobiales bacterium]